MKCPLCGFAAKVLHTEHEHGDAVTVRPKRCRRPTCRHKFTTHEFVLPTGKHFLEIMLALTAPRVSAPQRKETE